MSHMVVTDNLYESQAQSDALFELHMRKMRAAGARHRREQEAKILDLLCSMRERELDITPSARLGGVR